MGSAESFPSAEDELPDGGAPDFPVISPTGDASVDEVLETLSTVPHVDAAEQHAVYERIHDGLLAELNTEHG